MTFSYRLSLRYHQFVHRLLLILSRTYRDSSTLQDQLNVEISLHRTAAAKLSISEAQLADARTQIQTLTISARHAADDATRYREERDESRIREAEALRLAVNKLDGVVDWFALGGPRQPIFNKEFTPVPAPEKPEQTSFGGVSARSIVRESTRQFLKEVEETQRRQRENASYQPILDRDPDDTTPLPS